MWMKVTMARAPLRRSRQPEPHLDAVSTSQDADLGLSRVSTSSEIPSDLQRVYLGQAGASLT
jgi:hypothetical protein